MKVHFSFDALVSWAEAGGQSFRWVPVEDGFCQLWIGEHLLLHRARRCHGDAEMIESALKNLILTAGLEKPALSLDKAHFSLRTSSPKLDEQRLGSSLIWGGLDDKARDFFTSWPCSSLPKTVHEPQPVNLRVG